MSLIQVLETRDINEPSTVKLVVSMLQNGMDVNERDSKKRTPLMVAAGKEDNDVMLQILLDHGANLCDQDKSGRTALIYAFVLCCFQNVSFLLKFTHKCDFLNLHDKWGETALSIAVSWRMENLVSEIINRGADVNRHFRDNSPLLTSMWSCSETNEKILRNLLNAGSNVNYQNKFGLSPLMLAASHYTVSPLSFQLRSGDSLRINFIVKGCISHVLRSSLLGVGLHSAVSLMLNERDRFKNSHEAYQLLLTIRPYFERTIITLLEAGADVNAVCEKDDTITAVSFLPSVTYLGEVTIFCMEAFLERYARSGTVNPVVLQEVILHGAIAVIPKLIKCGLLPTEMKPNKTELGLDELDAPTLVSPLCLALLTGNISLASYFLKNMFLTSSDVSKLASDKKVKDILVKKNDLKCLNFLNKMAAQPMSLFKHAFVAVSTAVGTSPGRADRVNKLPIPSLIKNSLLFNSEQVELPLPADATP